MNKDIIKQSINFYGKDLQSLVCMEELAELIQAISKIKRYGNADKYKENLKEEIADVLICVELLKEMYEINESEIESVIDYKQKRIVERMNQE